MVHIGDLERTDIAGAKLAGYRAIRFTGITRMEEGETTVADFVTDNWTEIPGLVQMLDEESGMKVLSLREAEASRDIDIKMMATRSSRFRVFGTVGTDRAR